MKKKGRLDAVLDKSWSSRAFHFKASDLYDIIPNLPKYFNSTIPITVECIANGTTDITT